MYIYIYIWYISSSSIYIYHRRRRHHHHVPEGLGVFPVPWSSRWSWSLHLFLGHPMFLHPFGLYGSACFGRLFVSILYTCCSHFFWYCFISFVMFCAPVFCLIHWFFYLSSFVIPSKCLKNFKHSAKGAHPYRKACRSRDINVAAPPLDSSCDGPVTYSGDTKILVKSSKL